MQTEPSGKRHRVVAMPGAELLRSCAPILLCLPLSFAACATAPVEETESFPAPAPAAAAPAAAPDNPADDCALRMAEHYRQAGWVGITPAVDESGAVTVVELVERSPAEKAGVLLGDRIRAINGIPDTDKEAFGTAHESFRPGATAVFDLERDGKKLSAEILIEPIPEPVLEAWIRAECP